MKPLKKLLKKLLPRWLVKPALPAYHWLRAAVAAARAGFPAKQMRVVGVTGTNGKTTTAAIVASILEAAGYKVGVSTTAFFKVGEEYRPNDLNMTTTDPFQLQALLKEMKGAGCEWVVLEVTSHALKQRRVWGIPFHGAIMTNLTQDHLDYHGSMQAYAAAKGSLLRQAQQLAVLNGDDDWFDYFNGITRTHKLVYGTSADADVRLRKAAIGAGGSVLKVEFNGQEAEFASPLTGKFNAYNALAAITFAYGLELEGEAIASGLKQLEPIPGRLERIDEGQAFRVIVDYAHTPDAFENLFTSLKPLTKGRLIAVFGATGDRDRSKRPVMGSTAAHHCDVVVITDDEPYSEDAAKIRQAVLEGAADGGAKVMEEGDRRAAIRTALKQARPNDTVTILGMGHQQFRVMNDGKMAWDDREVTRELLQELTRPTDKKPAPKPGAKKPRPKK